MRFFSCLFFLVPVFLLSACGGAVVESTFVKLPPPPEGKPVTIALLLPLEGVEEKWRQAAADMEGAAEMALFDLAEPRLTLLIKNSGGTEEGAEEAAKEALAQGAELIIGPVLAAELAGAKTAVRGRVPVIALSGNKKAGEGLFLLGFVPEQEIERILIYAAERIEGDFAAFLPQSAYGLLARQVLWQVAEAKALGLTMIETYPAVLEEAIPQARFLTDYDRRVRVLTQEKAALELAAGWQSEVLRLRPARGRGGEAAFHHPLLSVEEAKARLEAIEEASTAGGTVFTALFLPEGGDLLRGLAQLLPFFEISPQEVKLLGTGLWDDTELGRELPLAGGWFAAPLAAKTRFHQRLASKRGGEPVRLASLAYDALLLVGAAIEETGGAPDTAFLRRAEGFSGLDGVFRFSPEGWTERGLAVLEVERGGAVVIDPPFLPPRNSQISAK